MPRIEFDPWADERNDEIADVTQWSSEVFDRVAFAERALALVRPRGTVVAIREGQRRVKVDMGRQWGEGAEARWAILSVPRDASRHAIVNAVLELGTSAHAGGGRGTPGARPWTLDVLLAVCKERA